MSIVTRPQALAYVNSLTRMEKLIAWALAWDFSYEEIAKITKTTYRNIKFHAYHVRQKMDLTNNYGIGIVLVLAEGVREPELMRYPGWPIAVIPEEDKEPITSTTQGL